MTSASYLGAVCEVLLLCVCHQTTLHYHVPYTQRNLLLLSISSYLLTGPHTAYIHEYKDAADARHRFIKHAPLKGVTKVCLPSMPSI